MKTRVAVWWTQKDGRGHWRLKVLPDGPTSVLDEEVRLENAETRRNEAGERSLEGGPRGWIEGDLVEGD